MIKFVVPLFFFTASGNTNHSGQSQDSGNDTIKESNITVTVNAAILKPFTDKKQLLGVWGSENKEPLTVVINEDSIYYTEHFESYKYKLKGDSIFINYPDFVYSGKLYFDNDTLVMESEDGKSKYVQSKK